MKFDIKSDPSIIVNPWIEIPNVVTAIVLLRWNPGMVLVPETQIYGAREKNFSQMQLGWMGIQTCCLK